MQSKSFHSLNLIFYTFADSLEYYGKWNAWEFDRADEQYKQISKNWYNSYLFLQ